MAALAALAILSGCASRGDGDGALSDSDRLVSVGDSTLYVHDVVKRIPVALPAEDSVALFNSIVANWRDSQLIEHFAEDNIDDLEQIEAMTRQYRQRLISQSYRRKLRQAGKSDISAAEIRRYYDAHKDEMVLTAPILKGIFLKVSAKAANLREIRQWVFSGRADGIDNLEKFGLTDALQYSYFEDNWVNWDVIEGLIPYRFGTPDSFLRSTRNFETERNGAIYLLHISNYLLGGRPMPYDYAAREIEEILTADQASAYEEQMLQQMRRQARKEGYLKEYSNAKP